MNYTYSEGYDANDKYYSKVTATNAKGAVSEEISDASGNVIKTTDKGTSGDTAIEIADEYDAEALLRKFTVQETISHTAMTALAE